MNNDLAKRAVACKDWRWLPGMLAIHPNFRDVRVSHVGLTGMHGACRYASPMGGVSRAVVALPLPTSSDVLPDLDKWIAHPPIDGSTEAEALVAALEAAP